MPRDSETKRLRHTVQRLMLEVRNLRAALDRRTAIYCVKAGDVRQGTREEGSGDGVRVH